MGDEEAVITELRLGPPGDATGTKNRKRAFSETAGDENSSTESSGGRGVDEPAAKGRVVGWPPVCSYRQRNAGAAPPVRKTYVKVSMDGAPYLRKVELDACRGGYTDLTAAVERLFGIGEFTGNDSEGYIEIYEDKEGDWMLVGDVPWDMFIESCKRLRIMKRSEAKRFGLQLRRSPSSDERKM